MPYRPPPPPARKRKQAPSPEDVHQGAHKPPHPPPKPKPAPSPEDVHTGAHSPPHPPAPHHPPPPPDWVIRRQRRLRAAGFAVRVDGVWGPASQHFWDQYVHGRRPGGHVPDIAAVVKREFTAAERRQQAVVKRLAGIRPEIQAGLPAAHRVAEAALRASHVSHVLPPGLPDGRVAGTAVDEARRATQLSVARERRIAKAAAVRAREKPPEKMTLDDVVALTVDPLTGHFNPTRAGDVRRVQRWLKSHGHARLAVDGVFGQATFKALQTSYFAAKEHEERAARARLTSVLYDSGVLRPGENVPGLGRVAGPGELMRELQGGGFGASIAWARLVELARDRGLEYQTFKEQELRKLDKSLFGGVAPPEFLTSDLDRYLRIAAAPVISPLAAKQLGVLRSSASFAELKRRLHGLQLQEAALRRHDLEAARHRSWWQGALDYTLVKPGEWTRSQLFKAGTAVYAVTTGEAQRPGADLSAMSEANRRWLVQNHPWVSLAFELVVDPVNLLPGVGEIGRAGVAGALRLERLGYALGEAGELTRLSALAKGGGLALTLPARSGRGAAAAGGFALGALSVGTESGRALRYSAVKATKLKSEAIATARLNVTSAMRHAFRRVDLPDSLDALPEFKFPGDFRKQVDAALAAVTGHVERSFPVLLSALERAGVSLFVTADRRELSNVGAALLARVSEVFRVNEVRKLALQRAQAEFERHSPDGVANLAAAEAAAREAYRDVVTRAGAYIRGAHDPDLQRVLYPRVQDNVDRFEHVVFRQMQDILEQRAEAAGGFLFDAEGRWVARGKLVAREFSRLGADAFDPARAVKLPNLNAGKVFTEAERNDLIEEEVSSEVGRLKSWYGREAAAGRPRSKEWLDRRVSQIESDARGAWTRVEGGWKDTREFREVPDIYARQASALYGLAHSGADPLMLASDVPADAREALAQLSRAPADVLDGDVEAELQRLAWSLAAGTGKGTFKLGPKLDGELGRYAPRGFDAGNAQALGKAVDAAAELLAQGFDVALPQALRREWAMYEALREAQGFWGRWAYKSVAGPLAVWKFATLPFRPGWGVRNIIDNTAKNLTRGVHNPLVYGGVNLTRGEAFASVFENDLRMIREVARKIDALFGTDVGDRFQVLIDSVWEHDVSVLRRIFRYHDIPVPEVVLDGARFNPFEEFGARAPRPFKSRKPRPDPGMLKRFRDNVWELMANRPENYSKRMLYRTTYARELERGASEVEAHEAAWRDVEETLFDYSKITVLEDNLRPLFPFIQFWRKNTRFWLGTAYDKPWLPVAMYRFEQGLKDDVHADLPAWMRRYVHTDEIGDGLSQIPGLEWLARYVSNLDVMTDPMNLFSFSPLYRAFRDENPLLPPDKAGMPFISGLIDGLNDWGLSMNPILRKGLEIEGVANYRSWQSVFPQTPLVEAFTRRFWHDRFPNGLNVEAFFEDPIAEHILGVGATELIAQNFNQWVQLEMANQRLRGDRVSRAAAERKIQDYFLMQTVVGYFTGVYVRRMTPQDFWLYKMQDEFVQGRADFKALSPREQEAYRLYKLRKIDAAEFDRYIAAIPQIRAYYQQGTYAAKERFKREHPEVIAFVEPAWAGKGLVGESYVQTAALVANTEFTRAMLDLSDQLRLPHDVRQAAQAVLVTPELVEFWKRNDTPAQERDKHLKLLFFDYVDKLNETYFAIPADDFEAKQGFLAQHPILVHWWQQNDTDSDEFKAVINASNATLRELFFEKVKTEGWDSANSFLRRYPFMFEFTKASHKVDPTTGEWIGDGPRRGRGLSQHARDYLAAKASLDEFFSLPEAQRSAWLASGSPAARAVQAYFARYAHFHGGRGRARSQHARDYLKARPYLEQFFRVLKKRGEDEAWLWLNGTAHKDAARLVKAYFRKYAHPNGNSQHAVDFLKAKPALDHYFKLDKPKRSAWLHSGGRQAELVLAYFAKWGKVARYERIFKKRGLLRSSRPELAQRLEFWRRYWQLSPDARPSFVIEHAADYGVFVYGPLDHGVVMRRENEYLRKAVALGAGEKAAVQVYVKPLLDFFFTLKTRDEKQLFLRANPELDYYFRHFVRSSVTGNKRTDKLVEAYFALPQHSQARTDFIERHKALQDYFDSRSTPADRAMHNLLELYFAKFGQERKDFGLRHPEIQAYFDKRKLERANESAVDQTFFRADPRVARFWELARVDITIPGQMVARELADKRVHVGGLGVRRSRRS